MVPGFPHRSAIIEQEMGGLVSQPNMVLRGLRERTLSSVSPGEHLTRQELADLVNYQVEALTGRPGALDANYIGKLERGIIAWPRLHYRAAFRAVLGAVNDRELGFSRPVQRDASDITRQVGTWRGFHAAVDRAGAQAYTDTLRILVVEATAEVAGRLGIPVGSTVLERTRIQGVVVNGTRQPVQLSSSWITGEVVSRLPVLRERDTGPGGMGSRMEEAGYRLGYEDMVTARLPSPQEQEQLAIPADQPVVIAWRRAFDQGGSGHALEVTLRIINPRLHELVYRYP
jgi:DNA-binding GntR family transcriptional regulator